MINLLSSKKRRTWPVNYDPNRGHFFLECKLAKESKLEGLMNSG